ncbi:putative bifunctional diguanylate cyclase/phosphodiesterase [Croceicoccus hydrothermalis]|uniref:putative bifunctional diguanylate cyclase/phosphodiesterase n=1 Tax=Croceicoccus hydrothermalis TaxID=2867964 RepID=UPI001EFB01D1
MPDALAIAQHDELQRQIPMLYAVLSVNAVAVAATHFHVAPLYMTLWIPLVLVTMSIVRAIAWRFRPRMNVNGAGAIRMLRRTTLLAAFIAFAYVSWSLALYSFAQDEQRAHVALFIATTVIGCIACLTYLPQAAMLVTVIVMVPYLSYQLSMGGPIYTAIAFNILLVLIMLIRVLLNNYHGFQKLVEARIESERLHEEVTHLANTDTLTGLPNRRYFFAKSTALMERCAHDGTPLVFGTIDLDRFKAANDTFGHALCDTLLAAVAERLCEALGEDAMIARLGGDEFAFVLQTDLHSAQRMAQAACRKIGQAFFLGDTRITVGASCGLAICGDEHADIVSLYDQADYALYYAKNHERGSSITYSAELDQTMRFERQLETALQNADYEAEFDIVLQPIVRLSDFHVIGGETLARWNSPTLGPVEPAVFIPVAERLGLINRLSLVLLGKMLRALGQMPRNVVLGFNLSAYDLASEETVAAIVDSIRGSGADASRIVLELTETAMLRDLDLARSAMEEFHALGARIALDDFGTGQSSLSYLHKLPIDVVKLDRSFIVESRIKRSRDLLQAVITLCRTMGLPCVAEGVEETEQLNMLRVMGCDNIQGHLFSAPMTVEQFEAMVKQASDPSASVA